MRREGKRLYLNVIAVASDLSLVVTFLSVSVSQRALPAATFKREDEDSGVSFLPFPCA